jgi:hypothetical protein
MENANVFWESGAENAKCNVGVAERLLNLGLFAATWLLHGRVSPEPLGAPWWLSVCGVVGAVSARQVWHGAWTRGRASFSRFHG